MKLDLIALIPRRTREKWVREVEEELEEFESSSVAYLKAVILTKIRRMLRL